ncbi:hypothetical protein F5X99DRAFT_421530 [Biscogniauxia marginata]|nr:hypothetical protein F5X99DRAFT_421530 [Biscogniauxia marginata]
MSIHYVESVSSGCGDRILFIEKYNAAAEDGDDEEEEMISDQILDAISFFFRTNVETNAAELIPKGNEDTTTHEEFELKCQLPANQDLVLPKFLTRDIHVLQKLLGDSYIARVSAGGREMCCKVGDELRADASQRELSCLLTISTSQHAAALRNTSPCSDTWELSTLQNIESVSLIAKARREKWVSQIQETLSGTVEGDFVAVKKILEFLEV